LNFNGNLSPPVARNEKRKRQKEWINRIEWIDWIDGNKKEEGRRQELKLKRENLAKYFKRIVGRRSFCSLARKIKCGSDTKKRCGWRRGKNERKDVAARSAINYVLKDRRVDDEEDTSRMLHQRARLFKEVTAIKLAAAESARTAAVVEQVVMFVSRTAERSFTDEGPKE
jgi:hypothetical protein